MSGMPSVLELFSIGPGPSSSHTLGPLRAATAFAADVRAAGMTGELEVAVTLYGSLAATGDGHGTPGAILAGLAGVAPEAATAADLRRRLERATATARVELGDLEVGFAGIERRPFDRLPRHPNALRLVASTRRARHEAIFFSIGGGFVERDGEPPPAAPPPVHEFDTAEQLLALCDGHGIAIAEVVRRNEVARHGDAVLDAGLDRIVAAMDRCIDAGLRTAGVLPGGLGVRRRAADWAVRLAADAAEGRPVDPMDELVVAAMAVNEQNAAGEQVVTAPTNGAAGIIPSVLRAARRSHGGEDPELARTFLLTAAAVGILLKRRASISGAELGCQGEVGSACAMAAAGLVAVRGGTPAQVENAAEVALEHHLGLTCDPVRGLVQIPCIERNGIAAVQAVTSARIALAGDGTHRVSLDQVIETLRQTGEDMSDAYKETSRGGLAVNVPDC